nr:integrase, catalytic region, zinc finger, CCHC-type, peptidase aspartic, catalytic [Tanacetum cinerariifolium]
MANLSHYGLDALAEVVQIVLWYLNSGCSKHITEDRSQLTNFVNKFLGIVKFKNDHVAKIMGYFDYQIENVMISRVYYVEGLGHNLFSIGQFCDYNLEVAFLKHTCFIHNLEGVDLLIGSPGNNLYTMSLGVMMASSPICILSKASKTKSWLWHRHALAEVVQIVLWYLNSGCSKHITEDRSQLTNFVNKFLGIVQFKNDHVAKIMGYFDYQIENVMISRVYYVEGLGHNLFSIGQFCDSNLEVAFHKHTCFIHNLEGVDLLIGSPGNNLYTMSLGVIMASSPICILSKASKTKSWLWHRRLSHLTLKYILIIVDDYSRFTWVKCLRSKDEALDLIIKFLKMIQVRLKTPVHRIKTNNGTEFVNQTLRDYFKKKQLLPSEPALHEMTPSTISLGLVPNPPPSTPYVPPLRSDWDITFQPLFDELLTPPPSVDLPAPKVIAPIVEVVAPEPAESTGSPSSTTVDQDAPSPSNSQTTPETQSLVISNDVEEENHDLNVAHMYNDPFFRIPILENNSESSSLDVIPTVVYTSALNSEHIANGSRIIL